MWQKHGERGALTHQGQTFFNQTARPGESRVPAFHCFFSLRYSSLPARLADLRVEHVSAVGLPRMANLRCDHVCDDLAANLHELVAIALNARLPVRA